MAKEVQKSNFPKFEEIIQDFLERLSTEWPKIIGQGCNLIFNKYDFKEFGQLEKEVSGSAVFLEYIISGEREGNMFIQFSTRDVIIIGGTIMMEEEADIKKNIAANELTEDYLDGFNEFGNQTAASFEAIFRNHFPDDEDNHIRYSKTLAPPYEPGVLKKEFRVMDDDDELFVVNNQCSIMTFDKGDINLILTIEMAESFFNEVVSASTKKAFAHIVLVDVNRKDIAFVKKTLRNTGYFVHICHDGDSAIAKLLQHEKMDLIIIDAHMDENEDENGMGLCLRIKRNMLLDSIPIIMTSAHATKQLVLDCARIGASDFMVKPLRRELLIAKLEKQIKRKKLSK